MTGTAPAGPAGGTWAVADGWECAALPAGSVTSPEDLADARADWLPAQVPGTVAGALRAAGRPVHVGELDHSDWWYRCRVAGKPGRWLLELGGVATVADVWLDGDHLLHGDSMFRSYRHPVDLDAAGNELVVRCAALAPVLAARRPRPRWKTYLVDHQNLRWMRTSLLGRIPGWAVVPPAVGLWRPVTLHPVADGTPSEVLLRAECDGEGGVVDVRFTLRGLREAPAARLRIGEETVALVSRGERDGLSVEGTLRLPRVDRWWPHTHGPQPRYEVWADVGGRSHRLGKVGFRTLSVDRDGGAFRVEVNGEPIFCRGACWTPPDPVSLTSPPEVERQRLGLARAAGLNMLRVPGTTVYESQRFLEHCDELGILVWHDCMFAFMDPPDDEHFTEEVEAEVAEAFATMAGHPSMAVVCGNQEVEEVAAMNGISAERSDTVLFTKTIAGLAESMLPGVPYVTSNPTGGDLPFRMGSGVSQYFGVGGYLRPVEDVRRAGVRFASECLAFATPPEPATVDEVCGGAYRAGHTPAWKEGVHHDAGRSWDLEDVRDHYVASLFGTDPLMERYVDAERALELGRAANAHLMGSVMTEWRRPGSTCAGALVLSLGDLRAGAGWGLVDVLGRPKAPWYALRRVLQPVALLATDEGLDGLAFHVVNDTAEPVRGRVVVELVARGSMVVERGEARVEAGPRGWCSLGAEEVLGGFRDVTYAYRFSPPGHDAVVATLYADDGPEVVAQVVHLPLGQARAREADLGLAAVARRSASGSGSGSWELEVRATRLAQWVTVRVPGFVAGDSWFHLPPGGRRTVALWPELDAVDPVPTGVVQALNAVDPVPIRMAVE